MLSASTFRPRQPHSRISCSSFVVAALAALSFPAIAAEANTEDSVFGGGVPPRAEAVFAAHAPTVDGVWNEAEWADAKAIFFPAPAGDVDAAQRPPCEVRFLWTKEGVYAAFRTTDTDPVFGDFKQGEPLYQEDVFELFIDQIGDHRQFYEIQIDPAGQLYFRNNLLTAPPRLTPEKRLTQEFVESELWRYDVPRPEGLQIASKLDAQTHVWTLEALLPASFVNKRLGGGPMMPCTWRVNLVRHDWDLPRDEPQRQGKFMYWAPVLPGHPHLSPNAMGWLEFLKQ